jgi:hypothetical protein
MLPLVLVKSYLSAWFSKRNRVELREAGENYVTRRFIIILTGKHTKNDIITLPYSIHDSMKNVNQIWPQNVMERDRLKAFWLMRRK